MISAAYLFFLFLTLLAAACLWELGAPAVEPREHLRIRDALEGGALYVVEEKEAA